MDMLLLVIVYIIKILFGGINIFVVDVVVVIVVLKFGL